MTKKRIVRPIIQGRLIYIYNPDPIRFFFLHKPEGLLIANFRFKVSYSRCNSKNLNKLHILIRSPLFCKTHDAGDSERGGGQPGCRWIGNVTRLTGTASQKKLKRQQDGNARAAESNAEDQGNDSTRIEGR